jgi:hypothetical protein
MEPAGRDLDPFLRIIASFVGTRITPRFARQPVETTSQFTCGKTSRSLAAWEDIAVRQQAKHYFALPLTITSPVCSELQQEIQVGRGCIRES